MDLEPVVYCSTLNRLFMFFVNDSDSDGFSSNEGKYTICYCKFINIDTSTDTVHSPTHSFPNALSYIIMFLFQVIWAKSSKQTSRPMSTSQKVKSWIGLCRYASHYVIYTLKRYSIEVSNEFLPLQ